MEFIDIVMLLLYVFCLVGVGCIVIEVIKHILDKKAAENRLVKMQADFDEFQKKTLESLSAYRKSYDSLHANFEELQRKYKKTLQDTDREVASLVSDVDKMIDMNNEFFSRIDLLEKLLSQQTYDKNDLQRLTLQISHDIEVQKKFHEMQRQQNLERNRRVEKARQRLIEDEPEILL